MVVSVAPERGTFVVGSADTLLVRVERGGLPVSSASLTISAEGARINDGPPLHTDSRGRARVDVEPTELNPSLRVEAHAFAETGFIDTALPVVLGGYHVAPLGRAARVDIAVNRADAFYSGAFAGAERAWRFVRDT